MRHIPTLAGLITAALTAAVLFTAAPAHAVVQDPGDTTVAPRTYYEQGILTRSGETVQALGPNLMGDQVNGRLARTLGWAYFVLICLLAVAAPVLFIATNGGG